MYYMTSGTTNTPTTSGFLLIHFEADVRIAQLAIINGVSNNYYIRTKPSGSGTTYSDWRRIITNEELEHNWENITIGIFASAATVQRYGLVKRIKINTYLKNTATGVTGNQAYTLATLAAEYRPKTSVVINAVVGRSSSGTTSTPIFARLEVGTNGIITLTPFQNITTNAISLDITYI